MTERTTRISKYLSRVLRHEPAAARMTLDAEGWVDVEMLCANIAGKHPESELNQVSTTRSSGWVRSP